MDGSRAPRRIDPAYGPVITSAVRIPDELDGNGATGRGLYIEDAGYPEFVSWMVQMADAPNALLKGAAVLAHLVRMRLGRGNADISAEVSELLGDCSLSAGGLPLLMMGRDVPDGRMSLEGDRLEVDWQQGPRLARLLRARAREGAGGHRTSWAATSSTTRSGCSAG